MTRAWEREESEAARNAIGQILLNSQMSALGRRPGLPGHRHRGGFPLKWVCRSASTASYLSSKKVDEGVRRAYTNAENPLRASIVSPPWGKRRNTGDNTPAVVHTENGSR
ncbi:MAG: hypothetical protein Ct9H300mP16_16050 [Pseudomonadota bacterium]|nr:MAG: hypothetical protein Ct9H300mP16_16050 [Pseudomonadota bacterium]